MVVSRRNVQLVLGGLWLLDGFLQLQPQMFTSIFTSKVVEPAASGQPFYIYDLMHLNIRLFLSHPALFNALVVIIQVGIGVLIINKVTTKYGLWASMAWGLFVWVVGEGAASLFSGQANLLMGAPGAALLYVIIALAVLPKDDDKNQKPDYWLALVWVVVWVGGAVYQLTPASDSADSLKSMLVLNAQSAPGWLAAVDNHVASSLNHFGAAGAANISSMSMMGAAGSGGYLFALLVAVIEFAIGVGVLFKKAFRQLAVVAGIILSLLFWLVGQSLGGYFTGVMTDPQTGPLLVLLGVCVIAQKDLVVNLKSVYKRLERLVVSS